MIGLPRFALAAALCFVFVMPALAAEAPAPSAELKDAVESYWHYGKIARYDLAVAEGQKIVASGAEPLTILAAFESVASARQDNIDQWLLRWQGVPEMKEVTEQIINLVSEGYRARRSSPQFIQEQIERLGVNERAYGLAVSRLRESGELAVPFMIEVLRDPGKRTMQPTIRRALRDLGRYALNPLVAATEMQDWDTLTVVVGVLGDLGYPAAAPYVARLLESNQTPAAVKAAAYEALGKLGASRSAGSQASDLFYDLAQMFYDDNCSITADVRFPMANVWYWQQQGLVRKQVPHAIFNEIMAMRACEYTLKLGGARSDDALSLWLAANYKREAELPRGQTDATRPENYPSGHYWGVEAGARYLNAALARAIKDRNAAVAFSSIRSLQQIVGAGNLFSGGQASQPLIDAMQFADRRVRFEAAFALAAALPEKDFEGSQRVVPLLAEALSQTGQPGVLVVVPSQDRLNALTDDLKKAGYAVAGGTSVEAAIDASAALAAIDVILVSEDLGPGNVDQLFVKASENPRLAGAARLVMTKTAASIYEPRKVADPLLSTTTATDLAGLQPAIESACGKAGALSMDGPTATEYATRAGQLMLNIGISRCKVYPLLPAKQALLAALSDSRPQIVMLAGQVLGLLNDKESQEGLLAVASDEKTSDEVKISLYRSLATNAKSFGNMLDASSLAILEKVVAEEENLQVRSAAAEARGALNLPADQAKALIVSQARM